jgi:hypothetical protein
MERAGSDVAAPLDAAVGNRIRPEVASLSDESVVGSDRCKKRKVRRSNVAT